MFDPILGMGKTPRITQDVTTLNPYSIYMDDISALAFVTSTLGAGFTKTGSELNVCNPNFDYVNNEALGFNAAGGTGATTCTLLLDLGKELVIRGTTFYFSVGPSDAGNKVTTVQVSKDNVTYTTLETVTTTETAATFYTKTYPDQSYRYLKISFTKDNTVGTSLSVRQIVLKVDSKQLIYSM